MERIRDAYVDVTLQPEVKIRTVKEVYQYDYGIALRIGGVMLDQIVEQHFAHEGQREADTVIPVYEDGYLIAEVPRSQLEQKKDITCYVYVEEGEVGFTVYEIRLPVRARVKPAKTIYSDEEDENYDRLISHLNQVIDEAQDLKNELLAEVEEMRGMEVVATTQPYTEDATASWDEETNTLTIGIPKGEPGSGTGEGGAAPPIDDTQASATHPWSGQKTQEELDKLGDEIESIGESVTSLGEAIANAQTEVDDVQDDVEEIQELLDTGNASQAGKILGYDENGNLVPMDPPKAEEGVSAVDDGNGNVILTSFSGSVTVNDDGAGNIVLGG